MATSATITGSATPGKTPRVEWEVTNQSGNTSTLKWWLKYSSNSGYSTFGTFSGTITINGKSYSVSGSVDSSGSGTIDSGTVSIPHNSDGTKTAAIKLTGGISGTSGWPSSYSGLSGSAKLDRIPQPPAKPSTPSVSSVKSSSFKATLGSAPSTNGASITGYVFQISTASDFTAGLSTISTGASTLSATFTGLAANTDYWVRVKAASGAGDSAYSSGRAVTTTPNAPAAPTSPTVTRVSDTTQNVGWSRAATSAAPYVNQYVERRDNVATAWIRASGALTGTATGFTDTTTVANRRYDYRVVAENAGGTGTSSVVSINTTPAAPTGVTAVKVGATIEVSWTLQATQAGITAHEVWDKPAGGVGVLVATVAGTATAWTDATPDTSKTHQYYVIAKAGALASAASTPSNVVQLLAPPLAPSRVGPTGAVDRAKAVLFAWKHEAVDTTAQSAYELQYRVNGGSWVVLTGTTAQTRSVTALGVSGTVEWQVRTKGQHATFGPWSAVWTFTLASQPTVLVSTPSGVYGSSRLTVVWAYANVDASGQASFEAELRRDGALLESRTGSSGAGSAAFISSLADRVGYSVRVRVRSGSGLWSDWASVDFTTAFPLPVSVTPIPEWDVDTGSVSLTFTLPDTPETYAWTGAPHASTSTKTKDGVTLTNLAPNGSFEGVNGTVEVRQNLHRDPLATSLSYWGKANEAETILLGNGEALTTCHAGNVDSGLSLNAGTTLEANGVYTMSADVEALVDMTVRISVQGAGISGNPVNSSPSLAFIAGEKRRVSFTFTANAAGGSVNIYILRRTSSGNEKWKTSKPLIEKSAMMRDYFDGSYSPDSDLVASWSGSVSGSSSRLVAITMHQVSPGSSRTRVVQSKQWAAQGESSARIIPFELDSGPTSRDTFASPGGDTGGWRLGMEAGKTYTTVAYCRLTGPQSGSLHGDARKIVMYWKAPTGNYLNMGSTPAPNEAGVHLVRHIFTVPADSTEAFIRLYNGASYGGGDVWWDPFTIAEGVHPDLMPWTGDTQSTTDVETITVQRQIGDGTWVTIASDIQPDSAITDPLPSLDGTTYYRALSKSADTDAPGPEIQAVWERPLGGTHFYLNAGDGFLTVAHAPGHQTDDQLTIEQSSHQFAGRPDPVVFYGEHETYTVPFTGPLIDTATPRQTWLQLLRERGIVCYRDSLGRRVFGTLTLQLPTAAGLTTVQGSITQADYTEGAAA
ncbi:fibronectin type III domain-containing protein [Timonella senegalensis]|uniref:fibronectin type III domain-containing protein n=2 Tax=Timonella senegalensis TaxID=1465825 RepID=UPI002FDCCE79